jgi:acetyl-CoA acetyltransferase
MSTSPVIAGVGMIPFGKFPDVSLPEMASAAARAALDDAGIAPEAVDAVFSANGSAGLLTGQESIRGQVSLKPAGIGGAPLFNVENACASGSSAVHLATQYIKAGAAHCVLVVGHEKMVTADKSLPFRALEACSDIAELAALKQGLGPDAGKRSIFMDYYAQKVQRYFASSGAGARHLAAIAAKNHGNGALNPFAQFRTPRTTEEVLAARVVVEPLTLLMCSPISDGAAALVLVSRDWARSHQKTGPEIAATAFATDSFATGSPQMAAVANRAYGQAGIKASDIHLAEVHDATAAGELFEYENLGLAETHQGWRLVEEGHVALGGRIPVNTSGGLLARGHPIGATGVAQVCELAWQLRGDAGARQVKGARLGVAQCAGGQSSFGRTSGAAAMCLTVVRA